MMNSNITNRINVSIKTYYTFERFQVEADICVVVP